MKKIAIKVMSYNKIIELSSGEVTVPKTINTSLQIPKPFKSGLLCEKIFGTLKLECYCGNYKGRDYIDMTCPSCNVQVTRRSELYGRLGHIDLTLPIIHPLATKGLSKVFNLSSKIIKDLVNCNSYIKYFPRKSGKLISKNGVTIDFKIKKKFKIKNNNNVTILADFISKVIDWERTYQINEYLQQLHDTGVNPLDYVLKAILVVPSGIRMPLKRDDGKYIESGLNTLYKKIILRCNKIKEMLPHKPPTVIKLLEWKLLQRAVNNLYIYGTFDIRGNKIKSILDMIKGKKGLPRNNLLGKRLDFSGRSVIVGNPQLPIDTVNIPIKMAIELYKPFIFNKLKEMKIVQTVREAREVVRSDKSVVKKVLLEVIKDKVVMLNRQPTLHRYGIQAFKIKVHDGHAIQIPPTVMSPFNADCFIGSTLIHTIDYGPIRIDKLYKKHNNIIGDGKSFYVWSVDIYGKLVKGKAHNPRIIKNVNKVIKITFSTGKSMICTFNSYLLNRDGKYIKAKDIVVNDIMMCVEGSSAVIGIRKFMLSKYIPTYELSVDVHRNFAIYGCSIVKNCDGDQMAIYVPLSSKSVSEVREKMTVENNIISSVDGKPLLVPSHEMLIGAYYMTNMNKANIFQDIIPSYDYLDYLLQTKELSINTTINYKNNTKLTCPGRVILSKILDYDIDFIITKKNIKNIIKLYYHKNGKEETKTMLYNFSKLTFEYATESGLSVAMKDFKMPSNRDTYFSEARNYCNSLDESTNENRIRKWYDTMLKLQKEMISELGKDNPVIIMLQSGARAKMSQVSQLNIAKGLISNYKGEVLLPPILHSLSEGLNQYEFLQTVYGSRKSMADKKFITPKSGYLARRLISASRDLYIIEEDCEIRDGILLPKNLAIGRFDVNGNLISDVSKINEDYVRVRSPIKCTSSGGICKKCYGLNPITRELIDRNIAIGVIAGQSITEITSQSSLRNFHLSGSVNISSSPLSIHSTISGKVAIKNNKSIFKRIRVINDKYTREYVINTKYSKSLVSDGDIVKPSDVIATYHQNIGQEDVSGMIDILEIYCEAKKKGYKKAIVSTISGIIDIRVKKDEIYVYVDGKLQGKTVSLPVYFGIGDYVEAGEFITQGEVCLSSIYERSKFNLDLVAKIFIERLIRLFKDEGINMLPVHIETIFRAMTEIVEDGNGKVNLRRLSKEISKIFLYGITKVSRKYPSWLKRLCFGWVKDCLEDVVSFSQESLDLPSERILYGGLLIDKKE